MKYTLFGQEVCLLPDKALFWPDKQVLIVSDVHLGKAAHFRKSGIAIPQSVHTEDLTRLANLINKTQAVKLIFLGDLFHSVPNLEWLQFEEWLNEAFEVSSLKEAILVLGNHDIHGKANLPKALKCMDRYELEGIIFTHEPLALDCIPPSKYNVCGHLHPAVILRGKGRQQMKLPCFFFDDKQGFLPAYGKFTGAMVMKPKSSSTVFMIAADEVFPLR